MRFRQATQFMPDGVKLIEVGAHQGELFDSLGSRLACGYGVEPLLTASVRRENYVLVPGFFPDVRPESSDWDAVALLAVLEHVKPAQQAEIALACRQLLRPGGKVIVTVPSKLVDPILTLLVTLRLIDGMSLDEHYGFDPSMTPRIFAPPDFSLLARRTFQLGLNNLFVFERN